MNLSQDSLESMGPTKAVDAVYRKLGGIKGNTRSSSLPNLQQVQNLAKRMGDHFSIRNSGPLKPDDLVEYVEKACADPGSMVALWKVA